MLPMQSAWRAGMDFPALELQNFPTIFCAVENFSAIRTVLVFFIINYLAKMRKTHLNW